MPQHIFNSRKMKKLRSGLVYPYARQGEHARHAGLLAVRMFKVGGLAIVA